MFGTLLFPPFDFVVLLLLSGVLLAFLLFFINFFCIELFLVYQRFLTSLSVRPGITVGIVKYSREKSTYMIRGMILNQEPVHTK